ncbi:MAG: SapC family protein, partial [Halorhodospira sp.]
WPLELHLGEQPQRLGGLYRVDEARLNALEGAALERLRDAGALPIAYAQLLSTGQRRRLEALAQVRQREQQLPGAEQVFGATDLEQRIDWDALDFDDDSPGQG